MSENTPPPDEKRGAQGSGADNIFPVDDDARSDLELADQNRNSDSEDALHTDTDATDPLQPDDPDETDPSLGEYDETGLEEDQEDLDVEDQPTVAIIPEPAGTEDEPIFLGEIDAEDGDIFLEMEEEEEIEGLTGEHFLLPHGIGALSLNVRRLPDKKRFHEDDEVVVIEHTGRAKRLQGKIETWYRGEDVEEWDENQYGDDGEYEPYDLLARNEYDDQEFDDDAEFDEDEVVTELAVWGPDGQIIRQGQARGYLEAARKIDEDDEIIIPSEDSLPPGARIPDRPEGPGLYGQNGRASARTSLMDLIETAVSGPSDSDNDDEPEQDSFAKLAEHQLFTEAPLPPSEVDTQQTPSESDEDLDDDLGLEFDDGDEDLEPDLVEQHRSKKEIQEPAATLAPSPAQPLTRSEPPPMTGRPVPALPSQVAEGSAMMVSDWEAARGSAQQSAPQRAEAGSGVGQPEAVAGGGHPAGAESGVGQPAAVVGGRQPATGDGGQPTVGAASDGLPVVGVGHPSGDAADFRQPLGAAIDGGQPAGLAVGLEGSPGLPGVGQPAGHSDGALLGDAAAPRFDKPPMMSQPRLFERPARLTEHSKLHYWIAFGLIAAILVIGYLGLATRKKAQRTEVIQGALQALSSRRHKDLSSALQTLETSPYHKESDVAALRELISWSLWTQEGIQTEALSPDGGSLDRITPESELALVVARAERDLMRRDILQGEAFLKLAVGERREPALLELRGRYALARQFEDPAYLVQAEARFRETLTALEANAPYALPVSQARVYYGLALSLESKPDSARAALNKALEADPDYLWAGLELKKIAVPQDAGFEEADHALRSILEQLGASLSPRQRATLELERARRALLVPNIDAALERLSSAVKVDPSNVDARFLLGQLYADQGQMSQAFEQLDAAHRIAPSDLRTLYTRVDLMLASAQSATARETVNELLSAYRDKAHARLARARLQREIGQLLGAQSELNAAIDVESRFFDFRLEQAILNLEQEKPGTDVLFKALIDEAVPEGRAALLPVLRAYAFVSGPKANETRALEAFADGLPDNTRALLVVGEHARKVGENAVAEKILRRAVRVGTLPRADLLLAQTIAGDPSRSKETLFFLRKVIAACGEGQMCDDARSMLEKPR